MVKEKLIDRDIESVLELLYQIGYGEHNILIYPDLDTFRDIYTHVCKKRIDNNNDMVLLCPHYEPVSSIKELLKELEINIEEMEKKGSLKIVDAAKVLFSANQSFSSILQDAEAEARKTYGKNGIFVLVDMGAFYHRKKINDLIEHEHSIPARASANVNYSLLCCYHQNDFDELNDQQKNMLCQHHYNDLRVRPRQ